MTKKPTPDASALKHHPFAALSSLKPTASTRVPPTPARHTSRSVRLHLESQGRSGKVVTRITGLPPANLAAIASRIGRALGCSATVDAGDVVLAGSLSERASQWLDRAGDLAAIREDPPPVRAPVSAVPAPQLVRHQPEAAATRRSSLRRGQRVAIVLKADQESGRLTEGTVREILTPSGTHPRGIKVRLESGEVGRVQVVYD